MPTEVAIIAKYSPQRFSSHSPTASMTSITAYAPAASASRVRVCGVSLNACWMRPSSLEWLTLKPSWRRNARSSGSALSYACSIDIRDVLNCQIATARAPKMTARRPRSTANTRRISALRSSFPRRTRGADDTGPLVVGSPMTKVPQRRQRQAAPSRVLTPSRSRSPGSSGAKVTWPLAPQPSRLQSMCRA